MHRNGIIAFPTQENTKKILSRAPKDPKQQGRQKRVRSNQFLAIKYDNSKQEPT